jgi:hypothetical protein
LRSARRSVEGEYARRRKALGERLEAVVEERGALSIRRPRSNFMYAGQVFVSALSVDGGPRGVLNVKVKVDAGMSGRCGGQFDGQRKKQRER